MTSEKLEDTYAQIDQASNDALVTCDVEMFSPKADTVLLFGWSDEAFGSEDLIAAAMPMDVDIQP